MKLLKEEFERNSNTGSVELKMENVDDMWHVYNIACRGDTIRGSTLRKIKEETKSGTVRTQQKKITVVLKIQKIEYDPEAPCIRIGGISVTESKYLQLKQHHTLELLPNIPFKLRKYNWDAIYTERLRQACDKSIGCEIAAIAMEEGLATLCLISNVVVLNKATIESSIPRKRKGASQHDKSLQSFFEKCKRAIEHHINWDTVKTLVVASPGFLNQSFINYMEEHKSDAQWYQANRVHLAHSSSGTQQAISEMISDPALKATLGEMGWTQDMNDLDEFFRLLAVEPNKVAYSLADVASACEAQAIQIMFISDAKLRTKKLHDRELIIQTMQAVRANGGSVRTISSAGVAGQKLEQLSGVAALLRFPIYDFAEQASESEEEENEDEEIELNPEDIEAVDEDNF